MITTIEQAQRAPWSTAMKPTRLIADVVTGKLDVRDAAQRLPDGEGSNTGEPELPDSQDEDEELAES